MPAPADFLRFYLLCEVSSFLFQKVLSFSASCFWLPISGKICEGSEMLPYLQASTLSAMISRMLIEDNRTRRSEKRTLLLYLCHFSLPQVPEVTQSGLHVVGFHHRWRSPSLGNQSLLEWAADKPAWPLSHIRDIIIWTVSKAVFSRRATLYSKAVGLSANTFEK